MPEKSFIYSSVYSDVERVKHYWNKLKPDTSGVLTRGNWKEVIPLFEQISYQNSVVVLLWNIITNRFIYAIDKKNVLGYDASLYLADNGLDFSMSNFHPETFHAGLIMQQKGFEFFTPDKKEQNNTVVNLDGKYKRAGGDYIHFLQQIMGISFDHKGQTMIFLSYIHNISHLKKDGTANLVISVPEGVRCWNFNYDTNNLDELKPLSKQEKAILIYLAQGKSSKEIASDLFISSLTVDTPRRNLLKRTNCIDTTGMITYAKLVGLM